MFGRERSMSAEAYPWILSRLTWGRAKGYLTVMGLTLLGIELDVFIREATSCF